MDELNDRIVAILRYGAKHGDFALAQLREGSGLREDQVDFYRALLLDDSEPAGGQERYRLSLAATGIYMNMVAIEDARRQARSAYNWAVLSITVALMGVMIALGWRHWSVCFVLILPCAAFLRDWKG